MEMTKETAPDLGNKVHEREIPSDPALIPLLVIRLSSFLDDRGWISADKKKKIELCLDEAISNSVIHGNGRDFTKKVRVSIHTTKDQWRVVVQDEGGGFSFEQLSDPEDEEAIWKEGGRGVHLMDHYMEEFRYFDGGKTLVMGCSFP